MSLPLSPTRVKFHDVIHFGNFLEKLISDLGVKPGAFAIATGNTERNVYRWFDRERPPAGSAVRVIAEALEIPFEQFKPASEGITELPAKYRDRRRYWTAVQQAKEKGGKDAQSRAMEDEPTVTFQIEMTEPERRRVDALAVAWGVPVEVAVVRLIGEALDLRRTRRSALTEQQRNAIERTDTEEQEAKANRRKTPPPNGRKTA